jgi:hypothetical protein
MPREDASICREFATLAEVKWLSIDITDARARFGRDKGSGGVVPNLLAIVLLRRETKVRICAATCDNHVL